MADSKVTWGTGNFLNMARTSSDPSGLAWYSILLGYPVLGIWYWCCDQTIVQRVLAAKDEKHARLGPLFCAFLKIWPVFFFVLPGVICVALVQKNAFGGAAPQTAADTYTFLITHLLPVGLKGLVAAAMLAAAMQTCSAALNSTATLVAYDLFKRHKPDISDHKLVTIGKWTTVLGTILAIVASPLFGHYTTIFEGINKLISYVAPPITAVFLLGVFWKRASGKSAFITLVAGMGLGFGDVLSRLEQHLPRRLHAHRVPAARRLPRHHGGDDVPVPRAAQGGGEAARLGGLARAVARRGQGARAGQLSSGVGCGAGHVRGSLFHLSLTGNLPPNHESLAA